MPDLSIDSPTPVYVRVADWIESRIKSGELKPGSRLPPERN
jgi:DNA-binding GntR family transcriptional regulator